MPETEHIEDPRPDDSPGPVGGRHVALLTPFILAGSAGPMIAIIVDPPESIEALRVVGQAAACMLCMLIALGAPAYRWLLPRIRLHSLEDPPVSETEVASGFGVGTGIGTAGFLSLACLHMATGSGGGSTAVMLITIGPAVSGIVCYLTMWTTWSMWGSHSRSTDLDPDRNDLQ